MVAKRASSMSIIALVTLCLMSCVSTLGCLGCTIESRKITPPFDLKPQESFGLVLVDTKMTPSLCSYVDAPSKKCDIKEMGLPPKVTSSIGSSVVVGHNNKQTYILTAAHVCGGDDISKFVYKHPSGSHVNIVVEENVTKIRIADYYGKERIAEVYRIDKANDLCVLKTKETWGKPFEVSETNPVVGEKVYNVASPHKIWAPGMVLMMDGYYSGKNSIGFYHYTIPARPGSSGSPILNSEGKIVGMVQRAVANFENLAISTSTQAIREILSTLPQDNESSKHIPGANKLYFFTL